MARTLTEIKGQIISYKEDNLALQELDSSSSTAIWRLWIDIMALAIYTLETLFDLLKVEVNAIVSSSIVGSPEWYRTKALEFELGSNLVFIDNTYKFPEITDGTAPSVQIIKRASAEEVNGIVLIKVAKEESGSPIPLSVVEKEAFTAYMDKIRFAGVFLSIVSKAPDQMNVLMTVYYDPQLITSEGKSVEDPSVYPVLDAINAYTASLPWNGRLYRQQLTDAIQAVKGVSDVVIYQIFVKASGGSYAELTERYYVTDAGYVIFDEGNSTIEYNIN